MSKVLLLAMAFGLSDDAAIRVVLDAYVSNREGIRFASGSGTVRFGSVKRLSESDSSTIPWATEAHLFWAFNGDNCRLDFLYDPAISDESVEKHSSGKGKRWNVSKRMLTDGIRVLDVNLPVTGGVEQARIGSEVRRFAAVLMRPPLDLGMPKASLSPTSLERVLESAMQRRDGIDATCEPAPEVDGRQVMLVTARKNGVKWQQYWVDLERGGVPLRTDEFWDESGKLFVRESNLDVTEVRPGIWMPKRFRMILGPDLDGRGYQVRELTVDQFECNVPPPSNGLKVPLHARCSVSDLVRGEAFFLEKDYLFGFDSGYESLPSGKKVAISQSPSKVLEDWTSTSAQSGPRRWSRLAIGISLTACGLLAIAAVVAYGMNRRRSHRA